MTAFIRTAYQVAHDALLGLESAKFSLDQLESLLFAVNMLKEHPQHIGNLLDIAWGVAADGAKGVRCNYESISDALDELAPPILQSEIVARDSEVQP